MIEWYNIWVPFVGVVISCLATASVSLLISTKQNKENNKNTEAHLMNTIAQIEMKHRLTTEWNAKKELLELKTKQGEDLLKSIGFVSSNIFLFFKASFYKSNREIEITFRNEIAKIEILSCYFPNIDKKLENFINEHNRLFNDFVVFPYLEKNTEYFEINNDTIAKELLNLDHLINKCGREVSKEIKGLVTELENYSKHS